MSQNLQIQIDRLATFMLRIDCGFPTINDKYPQGMSATEAAEECIKSLIAENENLHRQLAVDGFLVPERKDA